MNEETQQEQDFTSFSAMPIDERIKQCLLESNIHTPTAIQELVIPMALEKRDLLGQAQTGTGKTLAFAIPIAEHLDISQKRVQALILTPTRELARQVCSEMEKLGKVIDFGVASVYGGVHQKGQVKALREGAQVVVGTPGRILDLIRQKHLKLEETGTIVLDEVDEMLDMGFYFEVESILSFLPKERQTMFFSATVPPKIQKLGRAYLRRPALLSTSDDNVMTDTTEHFFIEVPDNRRMEVLSDQIIVEDVKLGLVFCRTKLEADRVYRYLQKTGLQVERIHGDLPQKKREEVMRRYREANIHLLVATNVAARGLDIQGVTHVFNYKIPEDAETYVHRTGRTGRAGAAGRSISLVSPGEYYELVRIQDENSLAMIKLARPDKETVIERRVEKMLEQLKDELKTTDVSEMYKVVKKEIPITYRGRALALLLKKFVENGHSFDTPGVEARVSSSTVRLFFNVGSEHGIDEKTLSDFIKKKAGLLLTDITKVDIKDKFAFVNVPAHLEEQVITKLKGSKIKGNKVNVERSRSRSGGSRNKRRPSGNRRPNRSSDRSGGRGGSRKPDNSSQS